MNDNVGYPPHDTQTGGSTAVKRRAPRYGMIYASVSALAIAAALGSASLAPHPARAAGDAHAIEQQKFPSFAPLVQKVEGAVVSISVKVNANAKVAFNGEGPSQDQNPLKGTPFEKFFNGPNSPFKRFQEQPNGQPKIVMAQGSGFFISPDGYLVTNNHVAAGAVSLQVQTIDGKTYPAKVIGTDPRTDLALLKVDGHNGFPYVTFSHSGAKVGDWVIALGNPFGLSGTVTAGIVSAQGRNIGEGPYDNFLQIDAPVNKGNSGGPTFNQDGEVVGVNTAIYSPSGGSVGIAFAIPSNTVEQVVAALKEHGHVTRGWLGVQIQNVTPELADSLGLNSTGGALVAEVQKGSPAEKAGLASGDAVVKVNGMEVKNANDLSRTIAGLAPGEDVKLTVYRNGGTQSLTLEIGELRDQAAAADSGALQKNAAAEQLGILVEPASGSGGNGEEGLAIVSVDPSGKGAEAGLAEGDVILKAGTHQMRRAADLRQALSEAGKAGRKHVVALVKRNGSERFVALPANVG